MKCPKCKMNIRDDAKCCLHCGYQFNNMVAQPSTNPSAKPAISSAKIACSIISIFNLITFGPFVFYFAAMWLLFGAFSDSYFRYYSVLFICALYGIVSIVFAIVSLISLIKELCSR